MVSITTNFFPIIYLCFIVVQYDSYSHRVNCTVWGPWLSPTVFVDDGEPLVEFTCSAYLHTLDLLSWYQINESKQGTRLAMIQQKRGYGYTKVELRKSLEPSDNGTTLYCVKETIIPDKRPLEFQTIFSTPGIPLMFQRHIEPLETPYVTVDPSSEVIIFDEDDELEFVCGGSAPVDGRGLTWYLRAGIRVTAGHFVDARKPFIEFTCYVFSWPDDALSWYQSKGSNNLLLKRIRLHNPEDRERRGKWIEHTLNKTLEPSDNGSEIYCAQQSVSVNGSWATIVESKRLPVAFQKDIEPLEPAFVTVEPNNTTVHFDVNTTLRLTCSGSKPPGGGTYTWVRIDSNSNFSIPEDQKYDASTNSNVLQLSLSENYHRNQLYCLQGVLSDIQYNGSLYSKNCAKLVTSNKITLIQRRKEAENGITHRLPSSNKGATNWITLAIALPLVLAALGAAAALWALRRRRSPPAPPAAPATTDKDTEDYGDYVTLSRETAQVTYAVLDLPSPAARAQPAPEPALYAEIQRG